MAYVSIIAIVAIVGMFIMFSGTTKTTTTATTENTETLAGQAIKFKEMIPPDVYANACNADDECETNNLNVEGNVSVTGKLSAENHIVVLRSEGFIAVPNGKLHAGQVQLMDEHGGADASYACINHIGMIYRSQEPCVN